MLDNHGTAALHVHETTCGFLSSHLCVCPPPQNTHTPLVPLWLWQSPPWCSMLMGPKRKCGLSHTGKTYVDARQTILYPSLTHTHTHTHSTMPPSSSVMSKCQHGHRARGQVQLTASLSSTWHTVGTALWRLAPLTWQLWAKGGRWPNLSVKAVLAVSDAEEANYHPAGDSMVTAWANQDSRVREAESEEGGSVRIALSPTRQTRGPHSENSP